MPVSADQKELFSVPETRGMYRHRRMSQPKADAHEQQKRNEELMAKTCICKGVHGAVAQNAGANQKGGIPDETKRGHAQ